MVFKPFFKCRRCENKPKPFHLFQLLFECLKGIYRERCGRNAYAFPIRYLNFESIYTSLTYIVYQLKTHAI